MGRFRLRRPSGSAVIAVAALAVAVGGTGAYGASANFLLDTGNTGTKTTTLTASSVAGAGLQLTNLDTAKGATALGLDVAKGHAPFTVNSGTKVAKLNADRLDGVDSSGFLQGEGSVYTRAVSLSAGGAPFTGAMVPGLATVTLSCESDGSMGVQFNSSVNGENLFYSFPFEGSDDTDHQQIDAGNSYGVGVGTAQPTTLFQFSLQGDPNGVQTVGTLSIGAAYRQATSDCTFQVQAITTHQ